MKKWMETIDEKVDTRWTKEMMKQWMKEMDEKLD